MCGRENLKIDFKIELIITSTIFYRLHKLGYFYNGMKFENGRIS